MIVLFTDFGITGPYLGQMKAVLYRNAPDLPVVDLFADAPAYSIQTNAYLFAAYTSIFPANTVFLAVVDPGVGSKDRRPVVINCDGQWFVGPGNGLFDIVIKRANVVQQWEILWRPESLSSSFHGRDLFAPVAASLASGKLPALRVLPVEEERLTLVPDDLPKILYIDHFGNLISGIRSSSIDTNSTLLYQGKRLPRVNTFADVSPGHPLCYENSNGLLEIAVNQGRADHYFDVQVGDHIEVVDLDA